MTAPSWMTQYLPMEMTTCCPAVALRRSPRSITPVSDLTQAPSRQRDTNEAELTVVDDGLAAQDDVGRPRDQRFSGYLVLEGMSFR